jgi:arginine N-succinyltransferase
LFIAEFADRFSDRIAAEFPGLSDDSGRCPVWDAVGRRFFNMDYPQVERLTGGRNKAFIAELMPQAPIYVPLLPEAAQWAIGQLHPVGELPFSILLDEGFDTETYVDIFDGGPTVDARVAMVKTVARSRRVDSSQAMPAASAWQLVSNTRRDRFAAMLLPAQAAGSMLDTSARHWLGLQDDAALRVAPLDGAFA